MASARRRMSAVLLFHLAEDAHTQTRAGKRVSPDHLMRQAKLFTDGPHLILEQLAQRFQQFELHIIRQSADIVVTLDIVGLTGFCPGRFDDIGIDGPLGQPVGILNPLRLFFKNIDKQTADDLAFLFRIALTGQSGQKALFGINPDNLDPQIFGKGRHDLVPFPQTQQAVVDKDAGQLVADGTVDQGGGNRRINTAGESENDPIAADLATDTFNGILDDLTGGPLPAAAADLADKRIDQQFTARRMIDLGMKLHPVEIPC